MLIDQLSSMLCSSAPLQKVDDLIDKGEDATLGVPQSARPLVVASLFRRRPTSMLVVVSGEEAADRFANALAAYIGRRCVMRFQERADLPWQGDKVDAAVVGRRCRALCALTGKGEAPCVVVASARSLLRTVPPQGLDYYSPLAIVQGAEIPFEGIPARLIQGGYRRLDAMAGPGTFSVHGDTLDIWPASSTFPVRAEFFGDEVDGLRRIVPATGQSIGDLEAVDIYPCRELALSKAGVARAVKMLQPLAARDDELQSRLEMLQQDIPFPQMETFLPYLFNHVDTPIAHIRQNILVVLAEPRSLFDDATRAYDELQERAHAERYHLTGLYVKPSELAFGDHQRLTLASLMQAGTRPDAELKVKRPDIQGTEERMLGGLRGLIASGSTVVFSVPDRSARESMRLTLSDAVIPFTEHLDAAGAHEVARADGSSVFVDANGEIVDEPVSAPLEKGIVNLVDTDIPSGLVIPDAHLGIVALADASPRSAKRAAHRQLDPTNLTFPFKPGDYVVHAMHGIALFKEICRQEVVGVERDYLLLEYAEGDKLYVPFEQIDKVTRYVGPEGDAPRLTRLNTSDWSKAVGKARKSAKKLAFDLVDLYARRSTVMGFRYSPDTPWQHEMEESFPYQETPDQTKAIADVKADMESDRPMDRLICGDVGFGKTEVVLRAAFKAVQDKRQVMVLCPTTILAQQHYTTFSERFEPFDVKVEVLSRFRTPKEQQVALQGFASGDVDVLIGTHRLLSRDVNPKDLGLIVIDEEQRFGVQHKEQLKNLREQVDVLTLSATPIPRTMQMALSGVRDMSLIQTPPPERTPVKVHVGEWDEDIVSAAIRNEMARGGQTYYVSNRVKSIDEAVMRVQSAAPEARVGVAHGQMSEKELESVMEAFSARQIDVLVATTIIESGLDNPHTNTLIIEDSQRLGLAQLYQLKGRVGRSYAQAYAFFLFPSDSMLTEDATDRLAAIAEFQELGSGTKIAMRDLEIRGAGSMLGAEQSGNISQVGFDLFAQMLAEAVSQARGEDDIANADIRVDLPVSFFFPEEYMPPADQRVLYYRRLAAASYRDVIDRIEDEVKSRYGALPAPAENLFARSRIKVYASELDVTNVAVVSNKLVVEPIDMGAHGYADAVRMGGIYNGRLHRFSVPIPRSAQVTVFAEDTLKKLVGAKDKDTPGNTDAE